MQYSGRQYCADLGEYADLRLVHLLPGPLGAIAVPLSNDARIHAAAGSATAVGGDARLRPGVADIPPRLVEGGFLCVIPEPCRPLEPL